MNRDHRLDDLVRDALRREADGAARVTPPFDEAMRQLAGRLERRPAGAFGPDVRRAWVLLAAVAMLAVLLAATLMLGTGIIRPPWSDDETRLPNAEPPIFGFALDCDTDLADGHLVELSVLDGRQVTVEDDGQVLIVDASSPESLAYASFDAEITERRLSPRGVDLLLAAVADAQLTPGCRRVHASDSLSIKVATADGPIVVDLGSFPAAYIAGPATVRIAPEDEDRLLARLVDQLSDLAPWLPADAWADPQSRRFVPTVWEVAVTWIDSGQSPGDVLSFPSGKVLSGSNPDFAAIRLPNGESLDDDTCLVATDAEVGDLSEALDLASHERDVAWYVFSEDLRREYIVSAYALLPGEVPCDEPFATGPEGSEPPPATQLVEACRLLDAAGLDSVLDGVQLSDREDVTIMDVQATSCAASGEGDAGFPARAFVASLLDARASAEEAEAVVPGLFGTDVTREPIADGTVWLSGCWSRDCPPALLGWAADRLFLLTFDRDYFTGNSSMSADEASRVAAAMAAVLSSGGVPD